MINNKLTVCFLLFILALPCKPQSTCDNYYSEMPTDGVCDKYTIRIVSDKGNVEPIIFQNKCNVYNPNGEGNRKNDDKPLTKFKDRTISWTHFAFEGEITVEIETTTVIVDKDIKIFPSRLNISVEKIGDKTIRFKINKPGQYSVEIGADGYKNGLLLFADPPQKEKPNVNRQWLVVEKCTPKFLASIPTDITSLYFKPGEHNIDVYQLPAHIKNIYIEGGAWLYGAIVMDGADRSGVKIWGRGVLSGKKMHLRKSHSIEAKNGANNITVEGIVVADYVFFAIRLLGENNKIDWAKIVGGWIYNCDGIAAYAGSTISNCFIWANDDNIKIYRDNITVENITCWQLDNGAIFQLNWSTSKAKNCRIRNVDIFRSEWDSDRFNNGIISCRTSGGAQSDFVFENIKTETPVSHLFRLSPQGKENNPINNFIFKNWDVKMDKKQGKRNYIEGVSADSPIRNITFDNFVLNGQKLDRLNYIETGNFSIKNVININFK